MKRQNKFLLGENNKFSANKILFCLIKIKKNKYLTNEQPYVSLQLISKVTLISSSTIKYLPTFPLD